MNLKRAVPQGVHLVRGQYRCGLRRLTWSPREGANERPINCPAGGLLDQSRTALHARKRRGHCDTRKFGFGRGRAGECHRIGYDRHQRRVVTKGGVAADLHRLPWRVNHPNEPSVAIAIHRVRRTDIRRGVLIKDNAPVHTSGRSADVEFAAAIDAEARIGSGEEEGDVLAGHYRLAGDRQRPVVDDVEAVGERDRTLKLQSVAVCTLL